ncbi:hypothetical protein LZK82_25570 (plasmid) [Rhizobium leguminosarum]|nr:hypothetical protein LZK82_25570 [Rhizobium leguminosarum]
MLHGVRIRSVAARGARRASLCAGRDGPAAQCEGVYPILVLVNRLQKEHLA